MGMEYSKEKSVVLTDIERMRRNAAAGIADSFHDALTKLQEQDDQVAKLRRALELKGQGIRSDLQQLQTYLQQVQDNAGNQLGIPLPMDVAAPLKWSQDALGRVQIKMNEARDLAGKLLALEIDSRRLFQRRERMCKYARIQLKTRLQAAASWKVLKEFNESWNEGLDFISGLCIRRAGLDHGLCQIADQIIAEVRWTGVEAMAVPGRGGPGFVAQIVHLRLPEWSIWALPLTAHELWHLGVHDSSGPGDDAVLNDVLEGILEKARTSGDRSAEELEREVSLRWPDREFQLCLADVFGTFAMGPAYASACVGLALDPTDPVAEQRALSMFKALRSVPEFSAAEQLLRQQWTQVCPASENLKYEKWIDAQLKYLRDAAFEFRVDRWKQYRHDLVDALSKGNIEAFAKSGIQLRYVLSAAWKARTEYPDLVEGIMASTIDLCRHLIADNATQNSGQQGLANM